MLFDRPRILWDNRLKKLISISAVVDALPLPSKGMRSADVKAGEGLAIWLSSRQGRSIRGWPAAKAGDEPTTTLSFFSRGKMPLSSLSSSEDGLPGDPQISRHVTLPVANTVFVNGQRTTLYENAWEIESSGLGMGEIRHGDKTPVASYPVSLKCSPYELMTCGSAPLRALTEPRLVVGSMGNVLSQIEVDGKAVPASQELEKAVSAFIKSNPTSTEQGPLLVFALLRSKQVSAFGSDVDGAHGDFTSSLITTLWEGAQLYKCTGGGGGWGTRQGFLSLEPARDFEPQESTVDFPDLDDEQSIVKHLGSRGIQAGTCTVQFLVYCRHELSKSDSPETPAQDATAPAQDGTTTVVLGTATDPEARDHLVKDPDPHDTGVLFVPNHFGMISYRGAALGSLNTSSKTTLARTRLDVPNSIFSFRSFGPLYAQ